MPPGHPACGRSPHAINHYGQTSESQLPVAWQARSSVRHRHEATQSNLISSKANCNLEVHLRLLKEFGVQPTMSRSEG